MNCEEIIPVLKALHANPTTTPVFADWFEERGFTDTAELLRGKTFHHGHHVVEALIDGTMAFGRYFPRNEWARQAAVAEALKKLNAVTADYERLDYDLLYGARQKLMGTRQEDWHRIWPHHSWDWNKSARHTAVSPDGLKAQRVTMSLVKVKWEPHDLPTLWVGWVEMTVSFWVGRDPFTNRPIVTLFDPKLARDAVPKFIPF